MLTGSAANPRSGTAPNAEAVSAPPALMRNLRRLCGLERIELAPFPVSRTDSWRRLFMPFPPGRISREASARRPPYVCQRSVPQHCLQYRLQYYDRYRRAAGARSESAGAAVTDRDKMVAKPLKQIKAGAKAGEKSAEGVPARQSAIAEIIARRIEEDIVLGRRHPRERLIEQDLCDLFQTHR